MTRRNIARAVALLAVVLAISFGVRKVAQWSRQDRLAVEQIEALGGTIRMDGYGRAADLCFREITDADLAPLTHLQSLRLLDLRYSQLSDNGLNLVGQLSGITNLNLAHTAINGKGLRYLDSLPLVGLHLQSTFLNDDGLAMLTPRRSLRRLNLGTTRVSDKSIPHLMKFANLDELNLSDTDCTPQGIAQLQAALPEATIHSGSDRDSLEMGGELMLPGEPAWSLSTGRRTVRHVEKLQAPFQLVNYALFLDGGTQGLQLQDSAGTELFFCVPGSDSDIPPYPEDHAYVGGFHPSSPGCRMLPNDTEELPRLIEYLQDALKNSAANPGIDAERHQTMQEIAEGLLRRLKAFAGQGSGDGDPG